MGLTTVAQAAAGSCHSFVEGVELNLQKRHGLDSGRPMAAPAQSVARQCSAAASWAGTRISTGGVSRRFTCTTALQPALVVLARRSSLSPGT